MSSHSSLIAQFTHWFFFQSCFLCGDPSQQALCESCLADLPYHEHSPFRCPRCAKSTLQRLSIECKDCQSPPPPFSHTQALFSYDYPIDKIIHAAKFQSNFALLNLLGTLMSTHLNLKKRPDVLIPVPLHVKRLRERGYNQSLELAKSIAKYSGLPMNYTACERCRDTPPQSRLPAKQRKMNLKNAFRVFSIEPHWQHIVLIDDVMTTGTTVAELAKEFSKWGIPVIEIWCCARR